MPIDWIRIDKAKTLFRENACAPMSHFHARVESKNCSWNFSVKMRAFGVAIFIPGGEQALLMELFRENAAP
ncbi:hypothetical protein QT235_11660 [Geobacillus stearothermophilus]|nr:hypothetical protein QT235_11660 [Geobacillus stearothermophilus]